jgi:hypothetical protein
LRGLEGLKSAMENAGIPKEEGVSRLKAFAWTFFDFFVRHPEFLDLIMIFESRHFIYYEGADTGKSGGYQAACQRTSEEIANLITRSIEEEILAGRIRTPMAPRQLMLLLWGQIFGVVQILRIREKHFEASFGTSREALFEEFVEMLEKALAVQKE